MIYSRNLKTSQTRCGSSLDHRLNVVEPLCSVRFISLSHSIRINESAVTHSRGPCCKYWLQWTSIVRKRIFIIFENSSMGFIYRVDSHLVKIKIAFRYSLIWSCSKKKTSISSERSEPWRRSHHRSHSSFNVPFRHYVLSNTIKNA